MPESVKELRSCKVSDLWSSPNQEKAIMHTIGPAQVFAGPGSGKTYVTIQRIKHLITECGIDPSHILVITFTKAAAAEMQERFFRLVEPDRPLVWFGTFHALFYHILKRSSQYRDYSIITESKKRKLIRQIVNLHKQFSWIQEEDLDKLIESVNRYKASSIVGPVTLQEIQKEDIIFITKEYQSYLQEWKQMDFDDIVRYCRLLLLDSPETRSIWQTQFQFIMIDEFQDISPNQYEIIRLLAMPQNNLFIVGDDDQSIYGFRGASPDSMQEFMKDYPYAKRIFLDVNYRCGKPIVTASLKVIEENKNRVVKQIRAVHEKGEGFRLQILEEKTQEEEYLLEALRQKQIAGKLEKCALICRTNFDCALWAQYLHKNGIPFVMKEPVKNKFEHFVIQDLMAYLALAKGELRRKYFLRIMNRPVRYFKRDSVEGEKVSETELLNYYANMPVLQERVRKLFYHLRSMKNKKLHLQIHYIRKVIGYESYLQGKYGSQEASELIQRAVEFQKFSEQYQTLQNMRDYISQYGEMIQQSDTNNLSDKNLRNLHQGKKRQENESKGIRLLTMHASKGLEFDTVYLPDCQEGKIPSSKSNKPEEIEEERRMFYVAMTRAKQELCLLAYKGKSGKDIPSRFIKSL